MLGPRHGTPADVIVSCRKESGHFVDCEVDALGTGQISPTVNQNRLRSVYVPQQFWHGDVHSGYSVFHLQK